MLKSFELAGLVKAAMTFAQVMEEGHFGQVEEVISHFQDLKIGVGLDRLVEAVGESFDPLHQWVDCSPAS